MNLAEVYKKLKRGELYLGMYDPNGYFQHNSYIDDLMEKYRENLIEDISKEIMKIQMHYREIEKIRNCDAVGELFLELTSENVRKLSTGVHDGKIIWNTSERITAMCIEDKHESEIFAIKNIEFATKPDDKKNPYKVYIKIIFFYVGN
jgi:hypothetical protein